MRAEEGVRSSVPVQCLRDGDSLPVQFVHSRFTGGSVCSIVVLLSRPYRGIEAILDASAPNFCTGFAPKSSTSGCSIQGQTVCMDECRDRQHAADFTNDSLRSRLSFGGPKNTRKPDFITVDLRGLKATLMSRAPARRESVSVLVRRPVARKLGLAAVARDLCRQTARLWCGGRSLPAGHAVSDQECGSTMATEGLEGRPPSFLRCT